MNQAYLLEMFDYDAQSGGLIWKHRPDKPDFWNGRFSGKPLGGKSRGTDICNRGQIDGVKYMMNHLVWIYHHGDLPENACLVPLDGDKMNSRLENLVIATRSSCQADRRGNGKRSGKGVYPHGRKFKAEITLEGTKLYLGLFRTEQDAQEAYDMTLYEARGNRSELNSEIKRDIF